MKKILITALLLVGITATAQVKVGNNPTTIDTGTTNFQVEGTTTAEQFVVLKNGNVGIGTTTPNTLLTLSSPSTHLTIISNNGEKSKIVFRNQTTWRGVVEYDNLIDNMYFLVEQNEKMRILANGNVGIGTATPSNKLSVKGTTAGEGINISTTLTGANANIFMSVGSQSGSDRFLVFKNSFSDSSAGSRGFEYQNGSGTSLMSILQNGNVGIGTTTPAGMLNISGGSASVIIDRFVEGIAGANLHTRKARGTQSAPTAVLNGDQLGSVAFQGYDGTAYRAVAQVRADAAEDYSPSGYGSNLVFLNNPASGGGLTERMRLLSNGNFGIGTSTPAGKLTVGTGGNLLLNRSDNATGTSIYNGGALVGTIIDDLNSEPISLRIGGNTRVYVATTGNVGIGITAPTSRLHVVGLPVYADNATAKAAMGGAAAVGAFFHTGDGIVRVVF